MYNSKLYWILSYFSSSITGCTSIPAFTSLIGFPIGTTISAIDIRICAITAGIKKYKSIIKKKEKKHDKIVLLAKSKLNTIDALILKALIDWNINHDKFVLINNVLKEQNELTEEIKN